MLHVGALLFLVGNDLLAVLDLAGIVLDFLKALDDVLDGGFVGVIGDCYRLMLNVGDNLLDALFKADVLLDALLAILAVHLRHGGEYHGLDVLGAGHAQREGSDE